MYSKHEQTNQRCRLRPKPSQKNKTEATPEELEYLEWFAEKVMPCFNCGEFRGVKGHHVKEYSSDKKDHYCLIPLCEQCHMGPILSPHGTANKWRARYSMDVQRLQARFYYDMFQNETLKD